MASAKIPSRLVLLGCILAAAICFAGTAGASDAANVRGRAASEVLRVAGVVVAVGCAGLSKESGLLAGV